MIQVIILQYLSTLACVVWPLNYLILSLCHVHFETLVFIMQVINSGLQILNLHICFHKISVQLSTVSVDPLLLLDQIGNLLITLLLLLYQYSILLLQTLNVPNHQGNLLLS